MCRLKATLIQDAYVVEHVYDMLYISNGAQASATLLGYPFIVIIIVWPFLVLKLLASVV